MPAQPVLRTALAFSLGAGLLAVAWVMGLYFTGNNPYGPKRLLAIFFALAAVVFSQWWLRRYYAAGPGLGRALGVGALTALLTAALSAAGVYGLARAVGPAANQRYATEIERLLAAVQPEYLKQPNGQERYEQDRRNLARTPPGFAADDFRNKLLFGLMICVPGGIFFRK